MSCDWNDWNNGCPPNAPPASWQGWQESPYVNNPNNCGYPPGYTPLAPNGSYSTVPCLPYSGPPCQSFVRKSLITLSGTFEINAATSPQPSSAAVSLFYQNMQGAFVQSAIAMTDSGSPNYDWTATWDSSLTMGGWVQWAAFSQGAVQAATQGWFFIEANQANVV